MQLSHWYEIFIEIFSIFSTTEKDHFSTLHSQHLKKHIWDTITKKKHIELFSRAKRFKKTLFHTAMNWLLNVIYKIEQTNKITTWHPYRSHSLRFHFSFIQPPSDQFARSHWQLNHSIRSSSSHQRRVIGRGKIFPSLSPSFSVNTVFYTSHVALCTLLTSPLDAMWLQLHTTASTDTLQNWTRGFFVSPFLPSSRSPPTKFIIVGRAFLCHIELLCHLFIAICMLRSPPPQACARHYTTLRQPTTRALAHRVSSPSFSDHHHFLPPSPHHNAHAMLLSNFHHHSHIPSHDEREPMKHTHTTMIVASSESKNLAIQINIYAKIKLIF